MSARHEKRKGFASGIGGIGREKACFAAWRFRPEAFARRRGSRVIVVAGLALWLGGCGTVPSANLVATPSPRADPSCRVQLPAVAATGTDGPARLEASLERVRQETTFPRSLASKASFAGLNDEAVALVQVAQAREAARQAALKGQKVVAPQADATTHALLSLLPWAGTVDTVPVNLDKLAALASTLISGAADRVQAMNTLLPPDAKPDQQSETAPSGLNKSLMSFTLAGQSQTLRNINTLAAFRAFHLLALLSAAHLHTMLTMQPPATDEQLDTEVRIFNVARFLSAYFDAYFRGGQFLQVTFNQQEFLSTLATRVQHQLPAQGKTSSSTQDIVKAIKPAFDSADKNDFVTRLANSFPAELSSGDVASLSNDQIKDFLQPLFDKVCTEPGASDASCAISTMGKSAFVTRAGLSVQFSGVSFAIGGKDSIGITHTYPQLAQFGPQLVRVFVEALFDANGQHLPGVPNSTACDPTNHLFGASECMKPGDAANERVLRIDMLSASAEAISATGTGAILRGIGPAGLNNELVASMLETLAGVNARKITEKVLYTASNRAQCPLTPVALRVQAHVESDEAE